MSDPPVVLRPGNRDSHLGLLVACLAVASLAMGCRGASSPGARTTVEGATSAIESSEPSPATTQAKPEVEPEPAPVPAPDPWDSGRLDAALSAAHETMHELGAYRKPRAQSRGPSVDGALGEEIANAYGDGRALNWRGSLREIQQWTALAKFGRKAPGDLPERGPLAGWHLAVVVDGRLAYLHAWLPQTGPVAAPKIGRHRRVDGDRRWIALGDVLEPGVEYVPFKRDGSQSLHHQWGREQVIEDLVALARAYRERSGVPLGVGDISHVTGGKLKGHWTHQLGVDADVYLLSFPDRDGAQLGEPVNYVLSQRRGEDRWTTRPQGRGSAEPSDPDGHSATARRLELLAELALTNDAIAYFVHDATSVLGPFDARAQARREGRRYLHRRNQGFWPHHPDHVHLRWVPIDVELPGGTPRP